MEQQSLVESVKSSQGATPTIAQREMYLLEDEDDSSSTESLHYKNGMMFDDSFVPIMMQESGDGLMNSYMYSYENKGSDYSFFPSSGSGYMNEIHLL